MNKSYWIFFLPTRASGYTILKIRVTTPFMLLLMNATKKKLKAARFLKKDVDSMVKKAI